MAADSELAHRPGPRVRRALAGACVGLALVTACTDDGAVVNNSDPQWVSQKSPRSEVAVVFVHGIFGDTLGTWTNANNKTFFAYLDEVPDVGPKLDMFAFGFPSHMVKAGSFRIHEAGTKLSEALEFNRVFEYPAIVYVTHSMGGLVVLQNLLTRREQLEKVRLIVFYGTPQEGSQITTIAKEIAKNPALEEMLPADGNSFLQQLNDQWKALPTRPPLVCGYEKLATKGIMVVPWSSATRFCDGSATPIGGADHIGIVKPDRPGHDSLVLLVNALNKHVIGQQLTAKLETPDFVLEGDKLVFRLESPFGSARLLNAGGTALSFTLAQVDHKLHLWPDTPKSIPARQTEQLRIKLGYGAEQSEYRFTLQSTVTPDQAVLVRVPNLAALRNQQAQFVGSITGDLIEFLGNPERTASMAALSANDKTAANEIVQSVKRSVSKLTDKLPESAEWIVSAEYLAAAHWPGLAVTALQLAENASPKAIQSSSVQYLASVVSAQSGQAKIFKSTDVTKMSVVMPSKFGLATYMDQTGQSEKALVLAESLKKVPSLRAYGLSLEGDIWQQKGDFKAALAAYKASEAIIYTPLIKSRVGTLEVWGAPRSGNSKFEPIGRPEGAFVLKPGAKPENLTRDALKGARP